MHFTLRHFKVFPHYISIFETEDMNIQAYTDFSVLQYKWTVKKLQDVGDMFWEHGKFQDTSKFEQILDYFCHVATIFLGLLTKYIHDYIGQMTPPGAEGTKQRFVCLGVFFVSFCLVWFVCLIKNTKFYLQL